MSIQIEDYALDGLQIAYSPDRRDHVLYRAEPRAVFTDLMLRDTMADLPIENAPARIEPATARAACAAGDPGWWRGATLTVYCQRGVHGGRAVYRFVDRAEAVRGFLIAWPD